jgi:hypothetical protein
MQTWPRVLPERCQEREANTVLVQERSARLREVGTVPAKQTPSQHAATFAATDISVKPHARTCRYDLFT